jgi:hypothetical protein
VTIADLQYYKYRNDVLLLQEKGEERERENEWKQLKRNGGRTEGVNGLGIKDERGELKASLSLFSFTFLSFLWTSFSE